MDTDNTLVTILESNYMHEVQIAKTLLASRNINTFVFDENINSVYGGVIGGYKLKISTLDFEKGKKVLEDAKSEEN